MTIASGDAWFGRNSELLRPQNRFQMSYKKVEAAMYPQIEGELMDELCIPPLRLTQTGTQNSVCIQEVRTTTGLTMKTIKINPVTFEMARQLMKALGVEPLRCSEVDPTRIPEKRYVRRIDVNHRNGKTYERQTP